MASGTVKFYESEKGYGFIVPDGGQSDIFIRAVDLTASGLSALAAGDRVSFELRLEGRDQMIVAAIAMLGPE